MIRRRAIAIYDAMAVAFQIFWVWSYQRAAIVLSFDGFDAASDADMADVRRQILTFYEDIYASAFDVPKMRLLDDLLSPVALREITDESGGYAEVIHGSPDMVLATERIIEERHYQYTLWYSPKQTFDNLFHATCVRVQRAGDYVVRAHWELCGRTRSVAAGSRP